MVDATKKSTSFVLKHCSMCTDYMEKQVQYEVMSSQYQTAANVATAAYDRVNAAYDQVRMPSSGTFDLEGAIRASMHNFDDVAKMASTMFDEDSVVDSVEAR